MKRGGRSVVLLAAFVVGHVLLISGQVDGGGGTSLLERAVLTLLSPLQKGLAGGFRGVEELWAGYVDLRGVREENARLVQRNRELEAELRIQRASALQAERLRRLTGVQQALPVQTAIARVIARDGTPWFRTLTLDRGSSDGIGLDAAVIDAWGVLGRVIAVGATASRVQLLLHRDSGAGARIERSRVTGVVSGQVGPSEGRSMDLVMKYVPLRADVVVGDVVVTSGLDGIYPPELVIGEVRAVEQGSGLFQEVRVTPSARFREAEEVLVLARDAPQPELTETLE